MSRNSKAERAVDEPKKHRNGALKAFKKRGDIDTVTPDMVTGPGMSQAELAFMQDLRKRTQTSGAFLWRVGNLRILWIRSDSGNY